MPIYLKVVKLLFFPENYQNLFSYNLFISLIKPTAFNNKRHHHTITKIVMLLILFIVYNQQCMICMFVDDGLSPNKDSSHELKYPTHILTMEGKAVCRHDNSAKHRY